MIKTLSFATLILLGAASASFAQSKGVYSPTKGVICDRGSGFCADSNGISFGYSETYLGKTKAYRDFIKRVESVGYDSFNTEVYTLSIGVKCDHDKEVCRKGDGFGKVDTKLTNILF